MLTVYIVLHAIAALFGFVSGLIILSPKRAKQYRGLVVAYVYALVGMVVFVIGALAAHWQEITRTEQLIFPGLVVFGGYMVYRALHARGLLRTGHDDWQGVYMNDVGFTLIALFDGFTIVGAIDIGLPGFVVASLAIGAVIAGNYGIERYKKRSL